MTRQPKLSAMLLAVLMPGLFAAAAADAAAKKPITHEILWMMKRVGAPAVSPDGKWAVYSVLEPSYETKDAVSDLWLVATDGNAPARRITHTKEAKDDVDWSPDSTRIAFATKREGDELAQIYILDLSTGGGEARRLTNLSTGASRPKWRPDGQAILFQSRVYPGALDDEANKKIAAEHKARKYNVRAYDHFPVRYWNEWLDERQPTLLVQPVDSESAKDILSPTALAHESGFYGAETDTSVTLAPLWSPDGREILFVATTERWNAAFGHVHQHLYRMPATGGEPKPVGAAPGEYQELRFSADGKSLYCKYSPLNEEVYQALLKHKAWYIKKFGEIRDEWYVFPWGRPRPSDPTRHITSFKTAWKTVKKTAKVTGRWHDNRHTLITELAEAGTGDETIMQIAGHVDRQMLTHYSHIRMQAKREALEAVDRRRRRSPTPTTTSQQEASLSQ